MTAQVADPAEFVRQGRYAEAVGLYEARYAAVERLFGAVHPLTLTAANDVGYGYILTGQPARAVGILTRTLARPPGGVGRPGPRDHHRGGEPGHGPVERARATRRGRTETATDLCRDVCGPTTTRP